MTGLLAFCPAPPDFALDWDGMHAEFDWLRALDACAQSPEWHAEGDVGIHTRMVLESLVAHEEWRALDAADRACVFAACALHDVSKPETSKLVDGRITARGHSRKGAIRSREILWRAGVPLAQRELICHMVLHHQVPFFLVERDDAEALALRISWTARADLLALVAEADARGRVCADQQRLLDNIELFREACRDHGCYTTPRPFASPSHRVAYFANPSRHPDAPVAPRHRCRVTVLAGLPASGKDTWVAAHGGGRPVVSLDALRTRLGVRHGDGQGAVAHAAREQARAHLRAGTDFVWNATNLGLDVRRPLLRQLFDYDAAVEIVYLEAPPEVLEARNAERDAPVPARALARMLERWQVPDRTEAHEVSYAG